MQQNTYYFASDFHLGLDLALSSKERESRLVSWLEQISEHATKVYLVGDLFEFWFDYKYVIPNGFELFLGQLARMRDRNIAIEIFTGNHDMWMFHFFQDNYGIPVHKNPIEIELYGKKIHIGHGDGIGPGDHGYKFIKSVFRNPFFQFLYRQIHPNLAFRLARYFSLQSRSVQTNHNEVIWENERQLMFAQEYLKEHEIDYFIFGHRHIPMQVDIGGSTMYNLGDWMQHFSFLKLDESGFSLEFYKNPMGKTYRHTLV